MSADLDLDLVFLLPLLAVAIGIFFPLTVTVVDPSKTLMKPHVRVVMLRRLVILMLVLSTVLAITIPFQGLSNIAKALLLCAAVLLPVYAAHVCLNLFGMRRRKVRRKHSFGMRRRKVRRKHSNADEVTEIVEPEYPTLNRRTQTHARSEYKRTRRSEARTTSDTLFGSVDVVLSIDVVLDEEKTT